MLRARVGFAIEAMATRVTEVAISRQGPRLMLAEHLAGGAPVLLHRFSDIDDTLAQLDAHAFRLEGRGAAAGTVRRSEALAASGACSLSALATFDEHFLGRADF